MQEQLKKTMAENEKLRLIVSKYGSKVAHDHNYALQNLSNEQ